MSGARWSLPSLLEAEESSSNHPRRGPGVLVASGLTPSTLAATVFPYAFGSLPRFLNARAVLIEAQRTEAAGG